MKIRIEGEQREWMRRFCRCNMYSIEARLANQTPPKCDQRSVVVLWCVDLLEGDRFALPLCIDHAWAFYFRGLRGDWPRWEGFGEIIVPLVESSQPEAESEF